MKQVQPNPWDKVAERYPPGTVITGTVRNLTNYGAFIEIEEGIDGLLHVSDMSWVRKVSHPSEVRKGKITKLTNFGVFVELEPGLEGLLHISELADHKVESPEDVVKVGDEIEVKVLRVDAADRKIGLSRKRLTWSKEEDEAEAAAE